MTVVVASAQYRNSCRCGWISPLTIHDDMRNLLGDAHEEVCQDVIGVGPMCRMYVAGITTAIDRQWLRTQPILAFYADDGWLRIAAWEFVGGKIWRRLGEQRTWGVTA